MRIVLFLLLLLSPAVPAQTRPESVVARLYHWLLKVDTKVSQRLGEVEDSFTPELYGQLSQAYAHDPNTGNFLDFDPWSNSQIGAKNYSWGTARVDGSMAKVPITVTVLGGGTTRYTCILLKGGESWQVANLVYPEFDLLSVLKEINK